MIYDSGSVLMVCDRCRGELEVVAGHLIGKEGRLDFAMDYARRIGWKSIGGELICCKHAEEDD